MGNTTSTRKVNFEDVQYSMKNKNKFLLINTLESSRQDLLIKNTLPIDREEELINKLIKSNQNVNIIVYDENANAPNLMKKYNQLIGLGFINAIPPEWQITLETFIKKQSNIKIYDDDALYDEYLYTLVTG